MLSCKVRGPRIPSDRRQRHSDWSLFTPFVNYLFCRKLPRRWHSVECASRISHKKSHIQNSHVKTGLTVCGVATLFTWDSTLTFSFLVASIRTPATWLIVFVSFTSNSTICAMTASFSWNRINTKTRPCRIMWICNISGEAAGEIWSWSLLGMKGSSLVPSH